MFLTVKAVCNRNTTTGQAIPAFAEACQELNTRVGVIQTLAASQSVVTSGLAAAKRQFRKDMAAIAATIAAAVHACASKAGDPDLAARSDVPASDMMAGRANDALATATNIHDLATARLAALAPFGLTPAKLADLDGKIGVFAASLSLPRDAKISRSTITTRIAEEFAAADALLSDQMDALIGQFADDAPDFVQDYRNARAIVALGGGKATPPAPESPPAPAPPK